MNMNEKPMIDPETLNVLDNVTEEARLRTARRQEVVRSQNLEDLAGIVNLFGSFKNETGLKTYESQEVTDSIKSIMEFSTNKEMLNLIKANTLQTITNTFGIRKRVEELIDELIAKL